MGGPGFVSCIKVRGRRPACLGHRFFLFFVLFCNKLESEDEINIKIKFIWTIFQLNQNRRKHNLIQLENDPNEFYF